MGLDNVDFNACREREVVLSWRPGVNALAVAEHSIGLMLGLSRNIVKVDKSMKRAVWLKDGGFGLASKTLGIIGLGQVGFQLARLASAFGAKICFYDIEDKSEQIKGLDYMPVSLSELLAVSDFVSLHVPLTPRTRNMLAADQLSRYESRCYFN